MQMNKVQAKVINTQRIFTEEGISFVSFTYKATWLGDNSEIKLKENEIEDYSWFTKDEAMAKAVSGFDRAALIDL